MLELMLQEEDQKGEGDADDRELNDSLWIYPWMEEEKTSKDHSYCLADTWL